MSAWSLLPLDSTSCVGLPAGGTRAQFLYCEVSLKDWKFLFPTFCLETKGGAKSSSRFNADQSLNPKAASDESALCSTLNLDGL